MRIVSLVMVSGLLVLGLLNVQAESYNDLLAATDRSDPDSLYELVQWCQDHGYVSSANQHIREILAIDPNHTPTRELQGFVWYQNRWVHQSRLPADARRQLAQRQGPDLPPLRRRNAGSPGPGPEAIEWDAEIPPVPEKERGRRGFVTTIIERMKGQDIFAMEGNWRTLLRSEQRNIALAVLAEEMRDGTYKDLWGPSKIIEALLAEDSEEGRRQARAVLPFLNAVALENTNPDGLMAFAYIAQQLGDQRVVPTFIAVLADPARAEAHSAMRQALSSFMLFRESDITLAAARDWWARYHDQSPAVVLSEGLNDPDPWVRINAVQALSDESWDPRVMTTLIRLVGEGEAQVKGATGRELERLTGNDWGVNRRLGAADSQRIQEQLYDWWNEERGSFVPLHLRGQNAGPAQQATTRLDRWVRQLSDPEPGIAAGVTSQLRGQGETAYPALIRGLESADLIVRGRVRDLLREMTGQNFGYEPQRGSNEQRRQAIAAWRAWFETSVTKAQE